MDDFFLIFVLVFINSLAQLYQCSFSGELSAHEVESCLFMNDAEPAAMRTRRNTSQEDESKHHTDLN